MRSIARDSIVKTALVTGVIALSLITGCGGGTMPTSQPNPPPPNMSGAWNIGTESAATSPIIGIVVGSGTLTQKGNSVSGTLTLTGSPCASSGGSLTGTVTGTSLSLQLQEEDQFVSLTGTANPAFTMASGTYTTPSEGCLNGDFGTWHGVKGPPPPPPQFSGIWMFFTSSAPTSPTTASVNLIGRLNLTGNSVSGTLTLTGSPCASSGSLTGTVTGTSLSLQLQEGDQSVSLTGTADPTFANASGAYTASSGGCLNGDFGTWKGVKITD